MTLEAINVPDHDNLIFYLYKKVIQKRMNVIFSSKFQVFQIFGSFSGQK